MVLEAIVGSLLACCCTMIQLHHTTIIDVIHLGVCILAIIRRRPPTFDHLCVLLLHLLATIKICVPSKICVIICVRCYCTCCAAARVSCQHPAHSHGAPKIPKGR